MTVQELIDLLGKAKNKEATVYVGTYESIDIPYCEVIGIDDLSPFGSGEDNQQNYGEYWLMPRWTNDGFDPPQPDY